jgi:hypothetical protein
MGTKDRMTDRLSLDRRPGGIAIGEKIGEEKGSDRRAIGGNRRPIIELSDFFSPSPRHLQPSKECRKEYYLLS